jgi:NTP pyrophosphatase (non-canonical NTP hydrolase)
MLMQDLYNFVRETDVARNDPIERRTLIATLGLVGEIGSILSAIKKDLLSGKSGDEDANRALVRGELKEEIGDAIWYAIMLAQCLQDAEHDPDAADVFKAGIKRLRHHLTGKSRDNRRTQSQLTKGQISNFLEKAEGFLADTQATIDDYQLIAYETRRTEDLTLKEVCSAVLQQLAAQLTRDLLPDTELILNHEVHPKDPVKAIGEILWHLSALASLYGVKLSDCIGVAEEKSAFRNPQNKPSPNHLKKGHESEWFPDQFQVHFLDDGNGQTSMFWVGDGQVVKKLGASLTDNNYDGDGYRFHDVMHVAFAAYLGWSPNLRSFMKLKRKSSKSIDEVEDGGRAKILEEAVILEIHEVALAKRRQLRDAGHKKVGSPYAYDNALNFEFLKRLHDITYGHEVYANPKQDWEQAIINGYDCYHKLIEADGGIIHVDMINRNIRFAKVPTENNLDYKNPKYKDDET